MKFTLLSITAVFALASSESTASLRRRLSYEKVAGYSPGSLVRFTLVIMLPSFFSSLTSFRSLSILGNRSLRHRPGSERD